MPYIEEELEIQCRGENGKYGMLRRLDNGKYVVNIHLVDYEEYDQANKLYEKHLPEFCKAIKSALQQNRDRILSFPYLTGQSDLQFIMWSLIAKIVWNFEERINQILAEKYFSDITLVNREFTCIAVAYTDELEPAFDFYGCDGINASSVAGYRSVSVYNIYGKHIDAHFGCDHNLSQDQKLLMVLKAIDGISIDKLSETEKEIAAKALACGYLHKNGNSIEPKIIVIDKKDRENFERLSLDLNQDMGDLAEQIAAELAGFMRSHIPEYLMNEYPIYTSLIAGVRMHSRAIDKCIDEGLLLKPENRICAEGVLMIVER